MRRLWFLVVISIAMLLAVGCAQQPRPSASPPPPTETGVPPTNMPAPTVAPASPTSVPSPADTATPLPAIAATPTMPASAGKGTWTRVGPPELIVGPVAIDPANPDVLLASVRRPTRLTDGSVQTVDQGLSRSTDRGNTWTLVSPATRDRVVRFVEYDPKDPRIVYASIDSCVGTCTGDPRAFLLRSADGGESWSLVFHGSVNDIAIYGSDPMVAYLATGDIPSEKGPMIPAAGSTLGSRRQERGHEATRTALFGGLHLLKSAPPRAVGLAAPGSSAAHALGSTVKALAKSVDRGLTWSAQPFAYSAYLQSIALDPRNPSLILTSYQGDELGFGGDSYRSADGGMTWQQLPRGLGVSREQLGYIEFAFDGSGSAVYAKGDFGCGQGGCTSAVLRSTDGGERWQAVLSSTTPPTGSSVRYSSLLSNPLSADEIFVVQMLSQPALVSGGTCTLFEPGPWSVGRVLHATSQSGPFTQLGAALEDNGYVAGLAVDQANPRTLYLNTYGGEPCGSRTYDGLWAYTLLATPGELPATGETSIDSLIGLFFLGGGLAMLGLRLRTSLHSEWDRRSGCAR